MQRYIYKYQNNKTIRGVLFRILIKIHASRTYQLNDLKVFADGKIECFGERSINEIRELLILDKISIELPNNGALLYIPYLGNFNNSYVSNNDQIDFFINILTKTIEQLNDVIYVSKTECYYAFKDYLINQTEQNYITLKNLYFKLPEKERQLFEIVKERDPLIKLMETGKTFTNKEREYFLNDYFEGEWIDIK